MPAFADLYVSVDLSSRAVASQVLSALQSLTSVFGMGTGGPFALKTLTFVRCMLTENRIKIMNHRIKLKYSLLEHSSSSPRSISTSQLNTLLCLHLIPIYLVLFKGSYCFRMGYLILRVASRLDAFSVYPVPTWLLGHAIGMTTDTPEVSPTRSSRTKVSSSQISYAHAG